jgi:hypothetical protein
LTLIVMGMHFWNSKQFFRQAAKGKRWSSPYLSFVFRIVIGML